MVEGTPMATVYDWLGGRQGHAFTVESGLSKAAIALDDVLLHARETWKVDGEHPETYALDVYVRMTTLRLDPDELRDVFLDGNQLTLDFGLRGRVALIDNDRVD